MKAKLIKKYETGTFGTSGFKKREFVVEYAENPQYPEFIKFELVQDKCELLDGFEIGQEIDIEYNLKGRKWINPKSEEVYFNTIQAWRITADGTTVPHDSTPESEAIAKEAEETPEWLNSGGDKEVNPLPF